MNYHYSKSKNEAVSWLAGKKPEDLTFQDCIFARTIISRLVSYVYELETVICDSSKQEGRIHLFNPEDRFTWPTCETLVLVCNGKVYKTAKIDTEGQWFDQDDIWINPLIFKPKWWATLPVLRMVK